MYVYAAKKFIGSFAAAMDGLDAIVFTAGIGENDNQLREEICSGLIWFGVEIDREANSVQGRESNHFHPGIESKGVGNSDQRGVDDCPGSDGSNRPSVLPRFRNGLIPL